MHIDSKNTAQGEKNEMKKKNNVKKKIAKNVGCCLLAFSMAAQGVSVGTIHISAESVLNAGVPDYWSGITEKYCSGGVEWQYLRLHYNGPTYGEPIYQEYITDMKIVSVDNNVTDIMIPSEIKDCKVKGLAEGAFKNLKTIKSVRIPKTIERICNEAFRGCSLLENVTFEDITTLEKIGIYVFEECTSLKNSALPEQMITNGKIQLGMFKNCTSLEKINIEGENIKIPGWAFAGCANLEILTISDKVKNLEIESNAFEKTKLKEVEFPCNVKLGTNAFQENYYLSKVIFQNDADIGREAFYQSFSKNFNESEKLIKLKKGAVSIGYQAFAKCDGLKQVIFDDEVTSITLDYKPFQETAIEKLDFKGDNVSIMDGGLAAIPQLSEVSFHNKKTTLDEEPFYGRCKMGNRIKLDKVEKIVFDCEEVRYAGDQQRMNLYTDNYGTFHGLPNLKEIICEPRCRVFECELKETDKEEQAECSKLDTFYFKNRTIDLNGLVDERKNRKTILYGYQDSVGSYVERMKNDLSFSNTRNQDISYKSISSGISVVYQGEDIVEGNEINPNNIEVYENYKDGTKSDRIPYKSAESEDGYEYNYASYSLNGKDFLNVVYTITYGDSTCSLPVRVVKKKVEHFDVSYTGEEKIEGQTVSEDDFSISNISYNDHSVAEYADGEFSIELAGENRLKEGSNTIQITYQGKTIPYTLNARKKRIQKLDIVQADDSKKLFEGGKLSKQDFRVTATYDNGDVEEDFTDYTLEDYIVGRDVTKVIFLCGEYTQEYSYAGIPLKVDHLNVSYNNKGVEENGEINKADLEVTAVYNSGKEVVLKPEEYSFKTYTIIGGKENTIFVRYNGDPEVQEVPFYVTGIKKETQEVLLPVQTAVTESGGSPIFIQTEEPKDSEISIPARTEEPKGSENSILTQTEEPKVGGNPILPQVEEPKISENPVLPQTEEPKVGENSGLSQTEQPKGSEISMPAQTEEPKSSESPVAVQTEEPKGSGNLFPTQTEETKNSENPVLPQTEEPKVSENPASTEGVTADNIPNGSVLILKKTKYKLGLQEKVTLKLKEGSAKSFYSNDKKIATVNKNGVVTAKKTGKVEIIVKDKNGNQTTCTIIVGKAPKAVSASYKKKVMKVKQSIAIKAKLKQGYYSNKITYESSNTKVAEVSSKGKVTAKKKGKAVIWLKTYNNKKAKVVIYVKK